jgi:hypothetical protein
MASRAPALRSRDDLRAETAPTLETELFFGELHAILIDSDLVTDNFWFKHYEF